MTLDVLVPTCNRVSLLERTIRSLVHAPVPDGLDVAITVINNHSTDGTAELLEQLGAEFPGRFRVLYERRRGKSRALNVAIALSTADLIGMIDDDEEIDPTWYAEVARAMADERLDFVGGPYVPVWTIRPPKWLPDDYLAVLGAVDNGSEAAPRYRRRRRASKTDCRTRNRTAYPHTFPCAPVARKSSSTFANHKISINQRCVHFENIYFQLEICLSSLIATEQANKINIGNLRVIWGQARSSRAAIRPVADEQ